jgi:NAD(P)-dependent dehydrogenase (short-subunit alcohol dehydrogenase family)
MAHKDMSGRVVVVTGASAGVGRATAHRFARGGARVGLIGRDGAALDEVKAEIESFGGEAFAAPADVADAEAVFAAADAIARALGPIDVWVNDAMATVYAEVADTTPEEFRRVTEVTYLGFVHGTMAALRHMQPRNSGTIVQVGSSLAYRGIPLQAAYCGAKHAIRGFTDSLRSELIHNGSAIAVTMVQLPAVNTPQFDWARVHIDREPRPVPPVVQPEAVAAAIFRAAQCPRREFWLGVSTVKVILGSMAAPGCLDRLLARWAYRGEKSKRGVPPGRRDNLFEPVHDLHRTRGSYGQGASRSVLSFPGEDVRLALAGLGLLAAIALRFGGRNQSAPLRRIGRRWRQ